LRFIINNLFYQSRSKIIVRLIVGSGFGSNPRNRPESTSGFGSNFRNRSDAVSLVIVHFSLALLIIDGFRLGYRLSTNGNRYARYVNGNYCKRNLRVNLVNEKTMEIASYFKGERRKTNHMLWPISCSWHRDTLNPITSHIVSALFL